MKMPPHVNLSPIESWEAWMRGFQDKQTSLWAVISVEDRIPREHPLRRIKELADRRPAELSPVFNRTRRGLEAPIFR